MIDSRFKNGRTISAEEKCAHTRCKPTKHSPIVQRQMELQQYLDAKVGVVSHPNTFSDFCFFLQNHSVAIAKPRFGSYGVGISVVTEPPPPTLPSVCGEDETLLQEWIRPSKRLGGYRSSTTDTKIDYSWKLEQQFFDAQNRSCGQCHAWGTSDSCLCHSSPKNHSKYTSTKHCRKLQRLADFPMGNGLWNLELILLLMNYLESLAH